MAEVDQTVAAQIKPPTAPDVTGPITSLAQMQYWAAQGQRASADAALANQNVAAGQALLAAKQRAVQSIQGGMPADEAVNKSGLGVFDPTGSTATLANVATGNTLKANRDYAAANPGLAGAGAGPEYAAKAATAVPAATADVAKTQIANAQAKTQLFGQIGSMMQDPSPAARAQTIAFAKSVGAPQELIDQAAALPDDQYVMAGRHFQQAALTPEKYIENTGQPDYNKGVAKAATTVEKLGPGESIVAAPGSSAAMNGRPVPAMPTPGAPASMAAAATPGQPASGPNYYGLIAQREGGGNPTAVNKTSGAGGLFQFLPSTWASVRAAHPELGLSPNGFTDGSQAGVSQQIAAMKAFTADNAKQLSGSGVAVNDQTLRMAHFLGAGGAAQFIKAGAQNPDAIAAQLFPKEAKANPTIFYANGTQPRTLSQVYQVMTKGFGPGLSINAPGGPGGVVMGQGAPLAQPGGSPPPTPTAPVLPPPAAPASPAPPQAPAALPAPPAAAQSQPVAAPAPAPVAAPPAQAPAAINAPPLIPAGSSTPTAAAAVAPQPQNAGLETVASGMSKAALAEQEAQGKNYGELPGQLDKDASGAKDLITNIEEMQHHVGTWQMGKWADQEENAREGGQSIAHFFGINTPEWDQKIADFQAFNKLAANLPRAAAKELGSRTGIQELNLLGKSFPAPTTSEGGFEVIAPQLKGLADFKVAKQQAANQWRAANGNSVGPASFAGGKDFQTVWNENASPTAFVIHRMAQENPRALQAALARMKSQPGGQVALDNIIKQTKWAADAGLLQ